METGKLYKSGHFFSSRVGNSVFTSSPLEDGVQNPELGDTPWRVKVCHRAGPKATVKFQGQFHEEEPAKKTNKEQRVM